jgi:NAD(P)-dependent dehydrogenase (short-subunit alcohol dehydrogenase family)
MIIITGASRGIGNYLMGKFIAEEQKVIGFYNNTVPQNHTDNFYKVDISNENEIKSFISKEMNNLERIILINCAGTNYNSFAHKADTASWINVININLIGTFLIIKNLLTLMRDQEYGRIINLSSVVAQKGVPGTSAYAASKSALWGLTKSIAAENAKKGITINNLNLGYHDIGMIKEVPEKYHEKIKESIPMGIFGNPENIFSAVKFIIASDYTTGASIDVSGGLV